ncbi:Rgg/GadR/MutR family transcriptional regulator [Lactobacillus hamsteri]|uniref:Helix-turn-helix protein n=1 Tax=Lactobacillus hamsteri DSM 5661 = JCM 6256 TaxID=1423754 RepID=A0A0R1YFH5_9LACO|nr:helix-turn-helix transcriptional regulator [Lactobacillus hamsteri]KRM41248.1 helix-turn-helix protein [Lactobacillus hamsteri DSM 5661 = JCM 6256]
MFYQSNKFNIQFKKIRRSKGISIEKATNGITSKSHLSSWENGKTTMDLDIFIKLLNRINVQPSDFFKEYESYELRIYTDDVVKMYANNDVIELRELIKILKSNYQLNPQNKTIFFRLAIAANFYLDLSGYNLFSEKDTSLLWLHFSEIEKWYIEDIILFGNTQLLLNSVQVYQAARSLISHSVECNQINNTMVLNTVINVVFVLLKKKKVKLATKILEIISKQNITDDHAFELIRMQFMQMLIDYINNKNEKNMQIFFEALKILKFNNEVDNFNFAFSQIKDIYK